jgi:hypothetical protein
VLVGVGGDPVAGVGVGDVVAAAGAVEGGHDLHRHDLVVGAVGDDDGHAVAVGVGPLGLEQVAEGDPERTWPSSDPPAILQRFFSAALHGGLGNPSLENIPTGTSSSTRHLPLELVRSWLDDLCGLPAARHGGRGRPHS